jgi:hypothetical protein
MNMINEIVEDYVKHASADYVGLWQVANRVREDLGLLDDQKVRQKALIVVKHLLERGLCPGDYGKAGFNFWDQDEVDGIISRIDREWDPLSGDPTLANPICWFALRPA